MPRLLSVNVGLPRDVTWNGKTVRTAIWKSPVQGRQMVRKLNLVGDAQADLAGHGGEQRAVFVYQMESYPTGNSLSDVMTSSSASSEKTSLFRDFLPQSGRSLDLPVTASPAPKRGSQPGRCKRVIVTYVVKLPTSRLELLSRNDLCLARFLRSIRLS